MKNIVRQILLAVFLPLILTVSISGSEVAGAGPLKRFEQKLFGKSVNSRKEPKVRESPKVAKAKKAQAKSEAKIKKDYEKYIKASHKRSIEIQSPEVQERMKQNKKQTIVNNKERKKAVRAATKKAGKKYN